MRRSIVDFQFSIHCSIYYNFYYASYPNNFITDGFNREQARRD